MSRLINTYFTLPLFCISYYIYEYTHTHGFFPLVCSCSRALCYCFAFATSATPPPPACWHLVRNRFVPLALMHTALNIVSCLWCQWGKHFGPTWKKYYAFQKLLLCIIGTDLLVSTYVCVHGLCTWMQGQLLRFVMAPGCVIVVICSTTCNLRQTRFTSSVHTWKPANVSVNVRVSFLPTSLRRCFSSFFFSSLFFGCHFAVDSATYTHSNTHIHTYVCVEISLPKHHQLGLLCLTREHKKGRRVSERARQREREREQCIAFYDGNKNKFNILDICFKQLLLLLSIGYRLL